MSSHQNAGVDASGVDAETARREVVVGMVEGTDAGMVDMLGRHAATDELPDIDAGQVKVPLGVPLGGLGEVEASLHELVVDLLSHFKVGKRDAWSYHGAQPVGSGAVVELHGHDGTLADALQGAAPSGMDGGGGAGHGVVEQYRDAVGGGDSDAHAGHRGRHHVYSVEYLVAHDVAHVEQFGRHGAVLDAVDLVGEDDVGGGQSEPVGQQLAVACHVVGAVSAVGVDVERGVVCLTHAAMSGGGEGCDPFAEVIAEQTGFSLAGHHSPPRRIRNLPGLRYLRCRLHRQTRYPRPRRGALRQSGSYPCRGAPACLRL